MNSDQLTVLATIVRLGSFSAAAKALNRVPSAISYSIKILEQDFGIRLFTRETYRPRLTPAGQAIYQKAKAVLSELEELHELADQLRIGQEPVIRLDLSPICPTRLVTPILKKIAQEFPQTQLKISMEIFGGEALILHDEADISLTDQIKPNPKLESRKLFAIPMIAVASNQHPLAQGTRIPTKQALKRHFQVVVRSQSPLMAERSFGIMAENLTWRVNDFPTKRQLLLEGLGWGHLPQTMISQDLAVGDLVVLDIRFLPKNIAVLRLVRKRADNHGPVASRLWNLLCEAVPKPGWRNERVKETPPESSGATDPPAP